MWKWNINEYLTLKWKEIIAYNFFIAAKQLCDGMAVCISEQVNDT